MCAFRAKKSSSSWSIAANPGDALVWLTGQSGDLPADALKASLSDRDCSVFSAWNIGLKIVRAAKARRLILVLLALLAIAMSQAQESHNDPPGRVGRISYLDGKVSFLPAGQSQWSEATLNYVVTTGDHIHTDKKAKAEIEIGASTIRLSENTDLVITNLTDKVMQLGLNQGTMCLSAYELQSGDMAETDTPNGAITVLSEGKYRFDVDPSANSTVVDVTTGKLQVTGSGVSQVVETGQAFRVVGQNPPEVSPASIPSPDRFDEWCEQRDQRRAASNSSAYVNTMTPGYEDLDGYGRWIVEAEYGPVWFPTVAVEWVPYRVGHWTWIGPWGWTWIEAEPWGFCPFHFGRWVHIGVAWGWVPGPIPVVPVYSPAFVAFVGGSGVSVSVGVNWVGWFPLGPVEPFFPWYYHTDNYLRIINVTNIRNVTNIENIIHVTNINQVHYAYRSIATTAVPPDVFSRGLPVASHALRLPPAQLARAPIIPHPPVNPTATAAAPGRPVAPPPRALRAGANPVSHAAAPRPGPGEVRPTAPAIGGAPVHPGENPALEEQRPLITRMTPPPSPVPFSEVRPALNAHPGRPLEPRQLENMRMGRPPGPMMEPEFPPHVAPMPVPARHR